MIDRSKCHDKECPKPPDEIIEMSKKSEYGGCWYSHKGPVAVQKDGSYYLINWNPKGNISVISKVINYPKIKCPFVRKNIDGRYLVTPEIEEGFEWVFEDPGVKAVDKLDGTNICVIIENGVIQAIDNRGTRIVDSPQISTKMNAHEARLIQGVLKAIEKRHLENGRIYGELIGPTINGNLHGVEVPTFVPFEYLSSKCHWRSWVKNQYPKDFDTISKWLKELPSLYSQRHGVHVLAEGLVFYHPDGRKAKIRRDMFDWYKEEKK